MKEENYINKKECIRRGYIRKNGYIYKMSLLDKYAQKGWLEYGNPRFSKDDRLRAARRFQSDYEMSHFASVGISGTHEKIDLQTQKPIDIEAIFKTLVIDFDISFSIVSLKLIKSIVSVLLSIVN